MEANPGYRLPESQWQAYGRWLEDAESRWAPRGVAAVHLRYDSCSGAQLVNFDVDAARAFAADLLRLADEVDPEPAAEVELV